MYGSPTDSLLTGYYPHLIKLYKHVGIEFQRANYSYSLSKLSSASGKRKLVTAVLYNGNSGLSGISMPADTYDLNKGHSRFSMSNFIAQISFLASAAVLLLSYIRVILLACPLSKRRDTTFGAWIESNSPSNPLAKFLGFDTSWKLLCYDILLPLFSGICTASREEMLAHPVLDFLGTEPLLSSVRRRHLTLPEISPGQQIVSGRDCSGIITSQLTMCRTSLSACPGPYDIRTRIAPSRL